MTWSDSYAQQLREPLNATTRNVRRNLLIVSTVGIMIAKVGLFPTKITALGIEFSATNQHALIVLLILIILYLDVSFGVYLYAESSAWKLLFSKEYLDETRKREDDESSKKNQIGVGIYASLDKPPSKERNKATRRRILSLLKAKRAFQIRIVVEAFIPIAFSVFAIYALYTAKLAGSS